MTELEQFITDNWGPRCKTKDTDDFPEIMADGGRCPTCEMWDTYDEWKSKQ